MKYIFLDFDGVLHGEEYNIEMFTHAKMFCEAIAPYQENLKIVISSSWREQFHMSGLKKGFPPEYHHLIVDATPVHINGMNRHGRYAEILEYCQKHDIAKNDWIAIDDMEYLFPPDCANLILTKNTTGLTPKNLTRIVGFLISD